MHIKARMSYHITPVGLAYIQKAGEENSIDRDVKKELSFTVGENVLWFSLSGKLHEDYTHKQLELTSHMALILHIAIHPPNRKVLIKNT